MRYTSAARDERPTVPAAPEAKRVSGVRRAVRPGLEALLVEYLDESDAPDTVPRPALAQALAEQMCKR
jgi:hypothetical protein